MWIDALAAGLIKMGYEQLFLSFNTEIFLSSAGADVGDVRDRNAGKRANLLEQHLRHHLVHGGELDGRFTRLASSTCDLSGNLNFSEKP